MYQGTCRQTSNDEAAPKGQRYVSRVGAGMIQFSNLSSEQTAVTQLSVMATQALVLKSELFLVLDIRGFFYNYTSIVVNILIYVGVLSDW